MNEEIQNQVHDVSELTDTDIKINPDFYIHTGLLKAQQALLKDNLKEGYLQFCTLIDNIEVLCRASSMIDEEYDLKIQEYKSKKEIAKLDPIQQMVKVHNKMLEYMMFEVFNKKPLIQPLKDK